MESAEHPVPGPPPIGFPALGILPTRSVVTKLVCISVAVVLGPLMLYTASRLLRNWGWWRVDMANVDEEDIPERLCSNRRYVKVWYGWSIRELDGRRAKQKHQILSKKKPPGSVPRGPSNIIHWQITTQEQHSTLQSRYKEGKKVRQTPSMAEPSRREIRAGRRPLKLDYSSASQNKTRNMPALVSSDRSDGEVGGTVRRRHVPSSLITVWASGSEETERAATLQLFSPRMSDRELEGKHLELKEQNTQRGKPLRLGWFASMTGIRNRKTSRDFNSVRHQRPQAAIEKCETAGTPLRSVSYPELAATLQEKIRLEKIRTDRKVEGLDTPRGFTPKLGVLSSRVRGGTELISATIMTDQDSKIMLDSDMGPYHKEVMIDRYSPVIRTKIGLIERRPSPAPGWTLLKESPEALYENLDRYSNDSGQFGSDIRAPSGSSQYSFEEHPDVDHVAQEHPLKADLRISPTLQLHNGSHHPPHVRSFLKSPHRTPRDQALAELLSQGRRGPTRVILPQLVKELDLWNDSESDRESDSDSEHGYDRDDHESHNADHPAYISGSQENFNSQLQRKLFWLSFELAPGFRGPEDNPSDAMQHRMVSRFNAVSRTTEAEKKRLLAAAGRGPPLVVSGKPRRRKVSLTRVDSWRGAVNQSRRAADQAGGNAMLLDTISQYDIDSELELSDEDIDTAAWLVRKPPQGFPSHIMEPHPEEPVVVKKLLRHYKWEKLRRPHIIRRAKLRLQSGIRKKKRPNLIKRLSGGLIDTLQVEAPDKGKRFYPGANDGIRVNSPGDHPNNLDGAHDYESAVTTLDCPHVDGRQAVSRGRNPFGKLNGKSGRPALKLVEGSELQSRVVLEVTGSSKDLRAPRRVAFAEIEED